MGRGRVAPTCGELALLEQPYCLAAEGENLRLEIAHAHGAHVPGTRRHGRRRLHPQPGGVEREQPVAAAAAVGAEQLVAHLQ